MKVIGTRNLARLLESENKRYISEMDFARILNEYGDECDREYSFSPLKRVEQNKRLKEKLGKSYVDIGNRPR